ncbi:nitrite reductase, copper-containing [Rhodanobacter sp. B04]|uniref:copper-containing nitrite reductase n=1 Tax=Rhodanobacter sp. B04 TaxID=1945860 RepID=UPI00098720A2|nr:copper-containing nitrite reductase [Rhodanobacter sp. B04]OOG65960.1 nitrite reductase, copper-containing [Rhodanobacter sp. B04]
MSRLLPSLLAAAGLLAITAYIGSSAYAAHSVGSINGSTTVTGDFGPPQGPPIEEKLVAPPGVPAPIHRDHPARVIVRLETQEVVKEIADGVRYNFWTFNGTTPGPLIRVRQGDTVELHLKNDPNSHMAHNIDLHAVMGPGGGAASTVTPPGHESVFTFKALRSGTFIYHCATAPVPMHIANGMYGVIEVEPPEGLPKVDHEYYVTQGDFYTTGTYHEPGLQSFDMQKMLLEQPTYVLFNGREGSLTGANALTSNVGDTVRLFVGNGGPNLVSSFHVIGGIFDNANVEGGTLINHNVQTTLVPAGGTTMVELSTPVPGTLLLVDHSIARAFMQGALGEIKVSGPPQPAIYNKVSSGPVSGAAEPVAVVAEVSNANSAMADGKRVFTQICSACHQGNAMGLPGAFPPLAMSDYLNADPKRAIGIVLNGLSGKITVNSTGYESVMPAQGPNLNDEEIANVLTYVLNNFNNKGGSISPAEVKAVRAGGKPN